MTPAREYERVSGDVLRVGTLRREGAFVPLQGEREWGCGGEIIRVLREVIVYVVATLLLSICFRGYGYG